MPKQNITLHFGQHPIAGQVEAVDSDLVVTVGRGFALAGLTKEAAATVLCSAVRDGRIHLEDEALILMQAQGSTVRPPHMPGAKTRVAFGYRPLTKEESFEVGGASGAKIFFRDPRSGEPRSGIVLPREVDQDADEWLGQDLSDLPEGMHEFLDVYAWEGAAGNSSMDGSEYIELESAQCRAM